MVKGPLLSDRIVYLILLVSALLLYAGGLSIPYYSDDFQFLFDEPGENILRNFHGANEFNYFYRPLQSSLLAVIQVFFSENTVPVHLVHILLHATLCWLVYRFMRIWGLPVVYACTGAAFMLLSQANVHAVVSNDTFSQLASTLAGCASLYFVYSSLGGLPGGGSSPLARPEKKRYLLGLLMLAIALMSKESGIGYFPGVLIVIAWSCGRARSPARAALSTATLALPFAAVIAGYIWLRFAAIPLSGLQGTGTYGMQAGFNVFRNLSLLAFSMITPLSSVKVYAARVSGDRASLALASSSALAVIYLMIRGLSASRRWRLASFMAILALISLSPVLALNRVSELYSYAAMPFVSVIMGMAIGGLLFPFSRTPLPARIMNTFLILSVLLLNAASVIVKTSRMADCGRRASELIDQVTSYASGAPPGAKILLLDPADDPLDYSIFRISGFDLIEYSEHVILGKSGRDDISIGIVDEVDPDDHPGSDIRILELTQNGKVVPRSPAGSLRSP